jgi:hypothetical protein
MSEYEILLIVMLGGIGIALPPTLTRFMLYEKHANSNSNKSAID